MIDGIFYGDCAKSFGCREGPRHWTTISHLVAWYAVNILHIPVYVMMDDFWGICHQHRDDFLANKPPVQMQNLKHFLHQLGIETSDEKDVWGQTITIVGFQVSAAHLTIDLDPNKVTEFMQYLQPWCIPSSHKRKEFDILTGSLNWICSIYFFIKPFISPIYHQCAGKSRHNLILANTPTTDAITWILHHITTCPPTRLLLLESWSPDQANFHIYCDATLNGFGFWISEYQQGYWFHSSNEFQYPDGAPLSINSVELYAQIVAITFLGKSSSNAKVLMYTDNTNTFFNMNSLHSPVPFNYSLLQTFVTCEMTHSFSIMPQRISTQHNIIADLLSRNAIVQLQNMLPDSANKVAHFATWLAQAGYNPSTINQYIAVSYNFFGEFKKTGVVTLHTTSNPPNVSSNFMNSATFSVIGIPKIPTMTTSFLKQSSFLGDPNSAGCPGYISDKPDWKDCNPLPIIMAYLTSRIRLPTSPPLFMTSACNVPTRKWFMQRLQAYLHSNIGSKSLRGGGATDLALRDSMEYLDPLDYVDGIFNDGNWDVMTAAMTAAATVMTEFAGDKPGMSGTILGMVLCMNSTLTNISGSQSSCRCWVNLDSLIYKSLLQQFEYLRMVGLQILWTNTCGLESQLPLSPWCASAKELWSCTEKNYFDLLHLKRGAE
ncbi:hypothetical protein BDR26DRAFT_986040 [Obelidium mucronatum]|nr:hypothetical protein BDR26DRAFT_986040 [Obelidium mucronatum]